MAKIKVEKNVGYTVMSNYHFRNSGLSFKAMGLLSFMLSLPNNWDFSVEGLTQCAKDGRDSITAGLKELEQAGHLVRRQIRNERGRIIDTEYIIYEEPKLASDSAIENEVENNPVSDLSETGKSDDSKNIESQKSAINTASSPVTDFPLVVNSERILPVTEKPFTGNPLTEKPLTVNPQQINTNIINTKLLNTNELITDDESSSKTYSLKNIHNTYKNIFGYDEAVSASSKEVAEMVFNEIVEEESLPRLIDADVFKTLCQNIALYSKNINNQKAYTRACIKNILEASKVNESTFYGSVQSVSKIQKSDEYIQLSG